MTEKIKVIKKDELWVAIINGVESKALSIHDMAELLYVTVNPFDETTVDAPAEFWTKNDKQTHYGGIDG